MAAYRSIYGIVTDVTNIELTQFHTIKKKKFADKHYYAYYANNKYPDALIFPIALESYFSFKIKTAKGYRKYAGNAPITISLYDYQSLIVDCISIRLREMNRCYLHLATGLGKTRISIAICQQFDIPTLVIVPTIAIKEQWGGYNTPNVIILVINSAAKKPAEFFNSFGLLIIDEAHEWDRPMVLKILQKGQVYYTLSLSATPEYTPFLYHYFGQPMNMNTHATQWLGHVKRIKIKNQIDKPICNTIAGEEVISHICTLSTIMYEPNRVAIILREIHRLMVIHEITFIFAEHREFVKYLAQHFDESLVAILIGGRKPVVLPGVQLIFTTYAFSRRGIDIKNATVAVLATPHKSCLQQIVGRIIRKGSNEAIRREIVELSDSVMPFCNYWRQHLPVYQSLGWI